MRRIEWWYTLRFVPRKNHIFTKFCRLPAQLNVFTTEVVDFLQADHNRTDLRILVFGCSIGAEPYSIASVLRSRRPDVRFAMECFDIESSVIARAQAASYSMAELDTKPALTPDFVASTFDRVADGVAVKPAITQAVRFANGNVLDAALIERLGKADVVVAQNFLYHLGRPDAERAFVHLFSLLKPRAALLVDGTDLDMRARLTESAGLRPCATDLELIHTEAWRERGYVWPDVYWGLEPFDAQRRDAVRRYATIFLSDG